MTGPRHAGPLTPVTAAMSVVRRGTMPTTVTATADAIGAGKAFLILALRTRLLEEKIF